MSTALTQLHHHTTARAGAVARRNPRIYNIYHIHTLGGKGRGKELCRVFLYININRVVQCRVFLYSVVQCPVMEKILCPTVT